MLLSNTNRNEIESNDASLTTRASFLAILIPVPNTYSVQLNKITWYSTDDANYKRDAVNVLLFQRICVFVLFSCSFC